MVIMLCLGSELSLSGIYFHFDHLHDVSRSVNVTRGSMT